MILSARIGCRLRHFGHEAVCVAGGLESISAMTLTEVPHIQRHIATIAVTIASSTSLFDAGFNVRDSADGSK
jgi:hypothetical protein